MGMKIVNGKLVKGDDDTGAAGAAGSGSGSAKGGGGGGGPPARPGDWRCPSCGANVFASKRSCFKCHAPKPGSESIRGGSGSGAVGTAASASTLYQGSSGTTEADVGITHYLNQEGSWDCIVKHRYADFVVQEIDESGNVCRLGELIAPPEPGDGVANAADAQADGTEPPKPPSTEDGFAYLTEKGIVPAADVELIQTMTTSFGTGANAAPGVNTMDGLDYVILSPCDDKDKRRLTHEAVRKYFEGFESDVAENADGEKCIRIRRAGRAGKGSKRKGGGGGDRKAKRQAFDPRGRAKTGWPAGKPKFCEFTLCKEGKDTQDAIDVVGRLLRRNTNAFSYAGSKDKRGVTTQRVSAFQIHAADLAKLNERLMGLRLGSFCYKDDKLELGALQGNHFVVTLRRVQADAATIERAVACVRESGFINYFGLQRFGTGAVPTHAIGRAMLRGEYRAAVGLIMHPRQGEMHLSANLRVAQRRPEVAQARDHYTKHGNAREALKIAQNGFGMIERNVMERLARNPSGFSESLMGLPRNMRSMYVHAYQSLVWNRAATARAKLGLVVLEGDLVLPLDVDTESGEAKGEETPEVHIVSAEDVAASRYSFDQVVLPLPGFAMVYSTVEEVARVYEQSISADGIKFDQDQGGGGGPVVSLPGSYRRVLQRVDDLAAKRIGYTHDDEQLYVTDYDAALGRVDGVKENGDPDAGLPYTAVQLSFTLPRSCYATMLLRELTKGDSSTHAQRAKTQAMQADTAQAAATAAAAADMDCQTEANQPTAK